MIIELPHTTTREINHRLVAERDEGGAVALGRVLTLIIDAGTHDPESAIAASNTASREHPCRVIVLTEHEHEELDGQIRLGGDAGASEIVVLHHSPQQNNHLDTLVLPLLLPDAPVVAWWPYHAPDNPADHCLGRLARRRITDSTECPHPHDTLQRLAASYQSGDTDLAWTRATLWRALVAAMLDQPPYEPVHEVVVAGQHDHPSVDLIAAWLALELRCPARIERQRDVPAITTVRLERASGLLEITRPDGKVALLRQPGQPEHRIALPLRSLDECLTEELRRLDADDVYGEVLCKGLQKVEP